MKKHRGLLISLAAVILIAGACRAVWVATAEYPEPGEVIDVPVNEVPSLTLTLEEPGFSPFRGYTLRFAIAADTPEPYLLHQRPGENFWLEAHIDGQWRRLVCTLNPDVYFDQEDTLGADTIPPPSVSPRCWPFPPPR